MQFSKKTLYQLLVVAVATATNPSPNPPSPYAPPPSSPAEETLLGMPIAIAYIVFIAGGLAVLLILGVGTAWCCGVFESGVGMTSSGITSASASDNNLPTLKMSMSAKYKRGNNDQDA